MMSQAPRPPRQDVSFIGSFSRSQVAAAVATAVDFGLIFALVELFQVWYVAATAIGAFAGAITNFFMNRQWSFRASHDYWHHQALRYTLISGSSLILNTVGVYAVTEALKIHYSISVVLVSLVVAVFFNFPLHRYYVFR